MKKIMIMLFGLNVLFGGHSLLSIGIDNFFDPENGEAFDEPVDQIEGFVTVSNVTGHPIYFWQRLLDNETVSSNIPVGGTTQVDLSNAIVGLQMSVTVCEFQDQLLNQTISFFLPQGLNLLSITPNTVVNGYNLQPLELVAIE